MFFPASAMWAIAPRPAPRLANLLSPLLFFPLLALREALVRTAHAADATVAKRPPTAIGRRSQRHPPRWETRLVMVFRPSGVTILFRPIAILATSSKVASAAGQNRVPAGKVQAWLGGDLRIRCGSKISEGFHPPGIGGIEDGRPRIAL